MAVGARIRVYGDWDPSGVNKAKKDILSFSNQVEGFTSGMTKSFAGVGAAIGGAFALTAVVSTMTNFLRESTQAAMEDEKSMVALAVAMENMGLAAQNAPVEDFIKKLSLATGVADDNLRPALQRLITVTGDVATSQSALQLAMDISAGTGRDLDSVTTALAKAYGGQTTALGRLGVGLDQAVLKSKDMDKITAELSAKFEGQASAAAETMQGKMNRLTVAINEAKETLGYEFLAIIDNAATALGGVGGLTGAIDQTSETSANLVAAAGAVVEALADLRGEITGTGAAAQQSVDPITLFIGATADIIPASNPVVGAVGRVSAGFLVLKERLDALNGTDITMGGLLSALSDAFNAFTNPGKAATQMVVDFGKSTREARGAVSGTAAAAVAAGKAMGTTLTPETYDAATAADKAAKSYLALWESIWNTRRAAADLANTSGTVTSALAAGAKTGGVPEYWEKLRVAYGEAEKAASGAGKATDAAREADEKAAKAKDAFKKKLDEGREALQKSIDAAQEYGRKITESFVGFLDLGQAYEDFTARQSAVTEALAELNKYQSQIQGEATDEQKRKLAELQQAYRDAQDAAAHGSQSVVEEFVQQGKALSEFTDNLRKLLAANLSRPAFDAIMRETRQRGAEIAKALATGNIEENVRQVNAVYASVASMGEQVAMQATPVFEGAGIITARAMLETMIREFMPAGRKRRQLLASIDEMVAEALRNLGRMTGFSVAGGAPSGGGGGGGGGVEYVGNEVRFPTAGLSNAQVSDMIDGILMGGGIPVPFAKGGIVTSPTLALIGEAGAEAVIPLNRNNGMGSTINLTVNAGMGTDGAEVGRQIVDALRQYQRRNGPVPISVA